MTHSLWLLIYDKHKANLWFTFCMTYLFSSVTFDKSDSNFFTKICELRSMFAFSSLNRFTTEFEKILIFQFSNKFKKCSEFCRIFQNKNGDFWNFPLFSGPQKIKLFLETLLDNKIKPLALLRACGFIDLLNCCDFVTHRPVLELHFL